MCRILVTYATKTGSVVEIAEHIREKLAESGAQVDVAPVEEAPDPSSYDAVVVGSGVRAGSWHLSARQWVAAHAPTLRSRPVAFFTVGLMITDPSKADEVRAYTDPVTASTGVEPVEIGTFAGWFEPERFGFVERSILKAMKAPRGDYRDWPEIEAWAGRTAKLLGFAD